PKRKEETEDDLEANVEKIIKILENAGAVLTHVAVDILTGRQYIHLLFINESKSCLAMHRYMGEFAYDLERRVGLIPGACPIPKGRYYVHDLLLDFDKITTISNFPFGNLRLTAYMYDSRTKDVCCIRAEIENNFIP
ncbi:hypothetical protein ILUMI_10616, partial [Ignelater luminosus]